MSNRVDSHCFLSYYTLRRFLRQQLRSGERPMPVSPAHERTGLRTAGIWLLLRPFRSLQIRGESVVGDGVPTAPAVRVLLLVDHKQLNVVGKGRAVAMTKVSTPIALNSLPPRPLSPSTLFPHDALAACPRLVPSRPQSSHPHPRRPNTLAVKDRRR